MQTDLEFYPRALARVYRNVAWVAAAGTLAALATMGWRWALSFALGAGASYFNFSWLHQFVEAIGPGARPPHKRLFVLVALRYLMLGAGGYVIVKFFGLNAIAAIVGLLVPVAAVVIEILYELVHGT
jgi:ATP synthase I chain